ncbi:MAG: type II toxin-antitoxin system antitoxin SocA domain-containing protein [Bacteroidota bacterium]
MSTIPVLTLADYVLSSYGPMSQLKLQKLLYYCEAYHLANFDTNLLNENFEAWLHGPVCPEVFHELKGQSLLYSDIAYTKGGNPKDEVVKILTSEQFDFITLVLEDLSTWTGPELERSTHSEKPWVEARIGYGEADRCNVVIGKESMKIYYKAELNGF